MAKSKKKWVALSTDQLLLESSPSSAKMVGDNLIHCAEPIPDHDWVGGTWGLFWSDYEDELRELLEEDTEKYIKKHPEDKVSPRVLEVEILSCPSKEKTPEIVEAPPPSSPPTPIPTPIVAPIPAPISAPISTPKKHVPKVNPSPTVKAVHPPIQPDTLTDMVVGSLGVLAKFEQKYDEGQHYINKHKESENKSLRASVLTIQCLTCPEQEVRPKTPPPTPPDLPCQKLRDNALHPSLPPSCGFEVKNVENEDKWGWMKEKEGDKSAGRTKYRLSMYW
eukprot:GFUD01083275.1.p1 GENE.GFUD01083275.1~~GFUD01083275.1.p1  ORF type:complete len:278 (+),score=98.57 GFUD01083275.1:151-984(+)